MAQIDQEIDARLKRLTRTVKMDGFRPGKVPLRVVAQQYGPQVRQEVLGETLQKSFGEAVREQAPRANILLLDNHGVLVYDTSLSEALMGLHTLEMTCRMWLAAQSAGVTMRSRAL